MKLYITIGLLGALLTACDERNNKSKQSVNNIKGNEQVITQAGRDAYVTVNQFMETIDKSTDYQVLLARRDKSLRLLKKHPDDIELQQDFSESKYNIKQFKQSIIKLAESFNRIPLNTDRLKQAKRAFDEGDFAKARVILDAEQMSKDQTVLLKQQQELAEKQQAIQKALNNNANEYLLKAKLTSINYSQPNRISLTSQYYELALKSKKTTNILFEYATFLQENNQYKSAEKHYRLVLNLYQQAAEEKPPSHQMFVSVTLLNLATVIKADKTRHKEAEKFLQKALKIQLQFEITHPLFQSFTAKILNNLANLVANDSNRRDEAERYYREALKIYRRLAEKNPRIYQKDVAMVLNNLANLVKDDSSQLEEAEKLHQEALKIYRKLAENMPDIYQSDVAWSLVVLGNLVAIDISRNKETEELYQEAVKIYRKLAKKNPQVHQIELAGVLHNFATFLRANSSRHTETKRLYLESLEIKRNLAKKNPQVYEDDLAMTLNNLASFEADYSHNYKIAEEFHLEALEIYSKRAKKAPQIYQVELAMTLNSLANIVKADSARRTEAETFFQEALIIHRQLAEKSPQIHQSDVALILNNLATLVITYGDQSERAEMLLREALKIYRQLAKNNSTVHRSNLALTLSNLARVLDESRRDETEALYEEAIRIYKQLAKKNPQMFILKLGNTLGSYGIAQLGWNEAAKANILLQTATSLLRPYAKQDPSTFGYEQAILLLQIIRVNPKDIQRNCAVSKEVLQVTLDKELRDVAQRFAKLVGCYSFNEANGG